MLAIRDNLVQSLSALRAHKLRSSLTMLGLTMGVATLITVMTLVQGANLYVENKVANLGTNVFQVARTPFAVTDFSPSSRLSNTKKLNSTISTPSRSAAPIASRLAPLRAQRPGSALGIRRCPTSASTGKPPALGDIDTRAVEMGRYFTPAEVEHHAGVCLIGNTLAEQLFLGMDPIGKTLRVGNDEFVVIGVMEKVGSVLGQDQDNFVAVPLPLFLQMQGMRTSLTINVKTSALNFEKAQDQARLVLRARRHLSGTMDDDFFIGTKESYMALWRSISSAFFAVFFLVSAISVIIGGIVIMNVMLVSVPLRRREIGVRRAVPEARSPSVREAAREAARQEAQRVARGAFRQDVARRRTKGQMFLPLSLSHVRS